MHLAPPVDFLLWGGGEHPGHQGHQGAIWYGRMWN